MLEAYTSGHFSFILDGAPTTAWVQSVGGGYVKGQVITEAVGPDDLAFRHLSRVEIEPIELKVAVSAAKPILEWIRDSWNRKFSRRDGSIVHGNFKREATIEQSFLQALLVEVGFPALDGGTKDSAYMTLKVHPEKLEILDASGKLQADEGDAKIKSWSPANFAVDIDGIDCTHVSKIDAITVKQKISSMYYGSDRYPQLEPSGIEFPTVTLYTSAAHAKDFIKWHNDFVVKGAKDPTMEKTGSISFHSPNSKNTLFSIDMDGVGINSLSIEKSTANADSIKQIKVELYVDTMDLKFEGPGFEKG